jgi:hypothetical protein
MLKRCDHCRRIKREPRCDRRYDIKGYSKYYGIYKVCLTCSHEVDQQLRPATVESHTWLPLAGFIEHRLSWIEEKQRKINEEKAVLETVKVSVAKRKQQEFDENLEKRRKAGEKLTLADYFCDE